ncbi:receptor-like protein 33 [Ziziphus jujuba]|uniref:Receptor-like protein 33 n=1 Tax=Ziziphus jujuba TaxID=326968 RepID=A0ABM3I2Y5_ZIZJJ|nr:receptor-like protein 33 [Ziziphus jujuba]
MTITPVVFFQWLLLLLPISSIFLSIDIYAVSGQCLSDQQTLMTRLKNSLEFPNNSDWALESDCCVWEGVTCHEGRVIGLDLRSNSWHLTNISTIFDLKYLESLDLSYEQYADDIPSRIGELTNLRYLNFSGSADHTFRQVPKEMSLLTKLVTLDLSSTSYVDPQKPLTKADLAFLIQNLTQLEELYLDGVDVSISGNELSKILSTSVPNLRELSMSVCRISGPIDQSLLELQYLAMINLEGNDLNATFPGFISNFSSLSSLHLSSCGLSGVVPKEIFQVPTLRALDISFNQLLQGSLPEFSNNNSLQSLVISNCHFHGTLPNSIVNLTQLVYLDLSFNNFTGPIPSLSKYLTKIDLCQNHFIGGIPSFRMPKNLTQINLSANNLSGEIPSSHLEGLLNLVEIDLSHNSLSGSIPSSLFAPSLLQKVFLSYNQLNGKIPEYPNASSSGLDTLDLSHNNLQGSIPKSIFELGNLKTFQLSSNNLNGTIQGRRFRRLGKLEDVDLSYNNLSLSFSGSNSLLQFPPTLGKLKLASCNLKVFPMLSKSFNLETLDLSRNQIDGLIPNWISDLEILLYLNLSFNQLEGIQEPFVFPALLLILDLHFNMLQGKLPILPPIAYFIDLSNNNFTSSIPVHRLSGDIPESICSIGLEALDLSNNGLSGRLPACIPEMAGQYLWILNLRDNNLSNSIPDTFPVNCTMKVLHLYGNSIQGGVPTSLTHCTKLKILDLGNNYISDHFPSFLMNISTMVILILRSNHFHGHTGCLNTNKTWVSFQMFDISLNNFSGELPRQCLRKWNTMTEESASNELLFYFNFPEFVTHYDVSPDFQDKVTTTLKGLELELVKMMTAFNTIDLSSNNFSGPIPEEFGQLESVYSLNFSNNGFTGKIPSSLGNLKELESLDLSHNHLSGTIPTSLANLNFLSFLNLSYNQLVGKIPTSTQLQSFPSNSFIGNKGLHGPPLTGSYTNRVPTPSRDPNHLSFETDHKIEWNIIIVEAGFITGFGIVVAPLIFCKRWRRSYFQHVEDMAFRIIPVCLLRKWLSWKKALENKRRRH